MRLNHCSDLDLPPARRQWQRSLVKCIRMHFPKPPTTDGIEPMLAQAAGLPVSLVPAHDSEGAGYGFPSGLGPADGPGDPRAGPADAGQRLPASPWLQGLLAELAAQWGFPRPLGAPTLIGGE